MLYEEGERLSGRAAERMGYHFADIYSRAQYFELCGFIECYIRPGVCGRGVDSSFAVEVLGLLRLPYGGRKVSDVAFAGRSCTRRQLMLKKNSSNEAVQVDEKLGRKGELYAKVRKPQIGIRCERSWLTDLIEHILQFILR